MLWLPRVRMHPNLLRRFLYCIIILGVIGSFQFAGLHLQLMEKDFSKFEYPIYGDVHPYVMQLRNNDKPSVEPINGYNYTYISSLQNKCKGEEKYRIILIVKSALENFQHRAIIRNSWGFGKRFSDVPMSTVFLLGSPSEPNDQLQQAIEAENKIHNDLIQANFADAYYNNTIKTMMGFKWAVTYCQNSQYYVFLDDDMYVSVKNLLRFLRNPSHYPEYVEEYMNLKAKIQNSQKSSNKSNGKGRILKSAHDETKTMRKTLQLNMDYELPDDAILYAGHVFDRKPLRHYSSKWYLNLDEYPFNRWPPYIPAGAYILSKEALHLMYYGSFFVKHFRFDDIYLAILAKKLGIQPFHNDYFVYKKPSDFKYVISFHNEFAKVNEMLQLWTEQKAAGNA